MGYRHYFYVANKIECEAVKNFTYNELLEYIKKKYPDSVEVEEYEGEDAETFINFHKMLGQEEIFEFGKLYWDDTAERIYAKGYPLFANDDTSEYFKNYDPYVMGSDGLMEAISIYKQKIINYYKNLLVDGAEVMAPLGITFKREDIKSIDKVHDHIKDQLYWWQTNAVNTDLDDPRLTKSWLYEHTIFELVRLYKSINWEKKCLLFYGY